MLVPGTFDGTIRLRRLLLHNNPVRTLEHFSFPPLRHLKLVDLSHCQLRTVGLSTFQGLAASLEELKLEVRRAVRETEVDNKSLLQDNSLTHLSRAALHQLSGLKSLSLSGNPWRCDCSLSWLWSWVASRHLLSSSSSLICSEPPARANIHWDKLGRS